MMRILLLVCAFGVLMNAAINLDHANERLAALEQATPALQTATLGTAYACGYLAGVKDAALAGAIKVALPSEDDDCATFRVNAMAP